MVFVTGDKHGDYHTVEDFCQRHGTTKEDILVVLGDCGVNYYGSKDRKLKRRLQDLPITFFFIRGNHDQRPSRKTYKKMLVLQDDLQGTCLVEAEYPSLLFAIDGEAYCLDGKSALVLGGAYSVDKAFRLEVGGGYRWFPDEQLSASERDFIWDKIKGCRFDVILSHTCPLQYKPVHGGTPWGKPDESMERWLDGVCDEIPHKKWYCGHWHIEKTVDRMRFMYDDIIEFGV